MNRFLLVAWLSIVFPLASLYSQTITNVDVAEDIAVFRSQFVAFQATYAQDDTSIRGLVESQLEDGTWADIDYKSKVRGEWPTRRHLDHLVDMARAYVNKQSSYYQRLPLQNKILAGIQHWLDEDYRNPNWYNTQIGPPERLGIILLLMGDAIPQQMLEQAMNTVLSDSRTGFGKTGQNRVWKAGVELMKGWLRKDASHMALAVDEIGEEIFVTQKEGVQADWSFHQHGAMLQSGVYGLPFLDSLVSWFVATDNTSFGFEPQKLEIFRNVVLHGTSWVMWGDTFDLNACGRQIDAHSQGEKAQQFRKVLESMMLFDLDYRAEYEKRLNWPNELIGSKVFWESDFAMHRRPGWYGSLRMCSSRLRGGEIVNNENLQCLHSSDGVLLLYQSGQEYEQIAGLWDWRRPPGTTIDQGIEDLSARKKDEMDGRTAFVGGLGKGDGGVSAMLYQRERDEGVLGMSSITASKAWFFEKDAIICLGAGVDGSSISNVYTSVEQSNLSGPVFSSKGQIESGKVSMPAGSWVQHANIGYHIESSSTVQVETVNGNWNTLFSDRGSRPVSGDIFSIWIDHGKSPEEQTYQYTIYPETSAADMPARIANHQTSILSNTKGLQAIENPTGVYAVFYDAGETLTRLDGSTIHVNEPCILSLRGKELTVCDPTQGLSLIQVNIDGRSVLMKLPKGANKGMQVSVKL